MRKNRTQRKYVIMALIIAMLVMTVGYAAYSTTLQITGTTNIDSEWNVRITEISSPTLSGSAEEVLHPSCTYNAGTNSGCGDGLTASMEVNLYSQGDSAEYDVTISNLGTIDAKLDDYVITNSSTDAILITTSGYIKGEKLYKSGHSGDEKVVHVKIQYNPEYNGGDVSGTASITFNYIQSDFENLDTNPTEIVSTTAHLVTFDSQTNGGVEDSYQGYFEEGDSIPLTREATKAGYMFKGWNTASNMNDCLKENDECKTSITMGDSDITLYAIFAEENATLSTSWTSTSSTITVVSTGTAESGVASYEYSIDNGVTWETGDDYYTFSELSKGTTYSIKVRMTTFYGKVITTETISASTLNIDYASFFENVGSTETIVTITYPSGCGTDYTCTYQKDSGATMNVTDESVDVAFATAGTLSATVSDGVNTTNSGYSVEFNGPSWSVETVTATGLTTWTAPKAGEYLLEVWGAQGGSYNSNYGVGGKGGYSHGVITLNQGDNLYIYNGGMGNYSSTSSYNTQTGGGINGGGAAGYRGGTGGGASDIRVGTDSLYARVIVAGGGGGAHSYSDAYKSNGGYGGGTTGGTGSYYSSSYSSFTGKGGTQTTGGSGGTGSYADNYGTAGSFGQGGKTGNKLNNTGYYSNGAGGGGWYGGGGAGNYNGYSHYSSAGGGGGSGYVYTEDTAGNYPEGNLLSSTYYLSDAETIGGNQEFNSPTGTLETGHTGNGATKISSEVPNSANFRLRLGVDDVTTSSISVTATTESGVLFTKYEFSFDNGATWVNNKASNIYTFTKLKDNTIYNLKVRATSASGTVVASAEGTTNEIQLPTFSSSRSLNTINVTIDYPSGCSGDFVCTYIKNKDAVQTVTSSSTIVGFTSLGYLSASVSDGVNTKTIGYIPSESINISKSTSKTTRSITVTTSVTQSTEVVKYEFTNDGGTTWVDNGTSNVYTFDELTDGTTYSINTRVTTSYGNIKSSTNESVTTDTIERPTFNQTVKSLSDIDIQITYPSGCGTTYTCTYIKDNEVPMNVTSTSTIVNFSEDGEIATYVTDGVNIVSSSYTLSLDNVISTHGVLLLPVSSGDGLYKEGTRYVYKGASPSNYIAFNNELWRIMSIESDGTLKIIRDEKLDTDMAYDASDSHRKSGYCSSYNYCNAWVSTANMVGSPARFSNGSAGGAVSDDSTLKKYLNTTYLSSITTNSDKIVQGTFNIGVSRTNNDTNSISQLQALEDDYQWTGSVGLATKSEYMNANTNSSCLTASALYSNYSTCKTTNYLFKTYSWWFLSPTSSSTYSELYAFNYGYVGYSNASSSYGVRPVLYLSSDVTMAGGSGTLNNPYILSAPSEQSINTLNKLGQDYRYIDNGLYNNLDGSYVYKGANPHNYITFNNELWRIMSIESDGTLKIIRDEKLGTSMAYDASDSHRKSGYCSSYNYCNAWVSTANMVGSPAQFSNAGTPGAVSDDSTLKKYLNTTYLSSITTNSDKIVQGTFNIGGSGTTSDTNSISQLQALEDDYQWTGSVGLATKSEYMNAHTNSSCLTASALYSNSSTCKATNYLFKTYSWWFLSPTSVDARNVLCVPSNGYVTTSYASSSIGVRPVLYLSSNINLTGTGADSEHAFTIS